LSSTPISTQPSSSTDQLLIDKLDENIVEQSLRLDDLAKLLVTLELSIPGLYVAALRLATPQTKLPAESVSLLISQPALSFAFVLWFIALGLSLYALFPKNYTVDRHTIRNSPPHEFKTPLSIDAFFTLSARHKRRYLVGSCLCFFAGVCAAAYSIL